MPKLESQIRDYINNPRKQYLLLKDRASWNKLCSSLDVIGDTELALDAYEKMVEPESKGENYLILYGILQILFVQQDAVTHLAESLDIPYSTDPAITAIREIRNNSIGHPTKRGGGKGKAFNFISRISMSKSGFTLITTYENDDIKLQNVNILQLIKSQRSILQTTLNDVIEKLKEEEMKHREEFKAKQLVDIFPQTLGYYFEKISEAIYESKPSEFGSIHVKRLIEIVDHFKDAVSERGILEAYYSINYELKLINYPLKELCSFFDNPQKSKLNSEDAYIFTFFIRKHIDNLTKFADELDEEYRSQA